MAALYDEFVTFGWQARLGYAKLLRSQALHKECANYCIDALQSPYEIGHVELIFLNFYAAISYDCLSFRIFDSERKLAYLSLSEDHYNAAATVARQLSAHRPSIDPGQRFQAYDRYSLEETTTAWPSTPSLCSDPGTTPESPSSLYTTNVQQQIRQGLPLGRDVRRQTEVFHSGSRRYDRNVSLGLVTPSLNPPKYLYADLDSLSELMFKHASYMEHSKGEIIAAQGRSKGPQDESMTTRMAEVSIQARIIEGRSRQWRKCTAFDARRTQELVDVALSEL